MSQPHIQLRNALLDDHVAKGWMDGDMFLAYSLMLRRCDWSTGIWHGSAASLSALSGGQWSLATAKRILKRLCLGRYITSHHVPKQMGNYDLAVNNYVPTSGENKGKKLRHTKTQDYRLRLTNEGFSHEPLDAPKRVTSEPLAGSPVSRIQDSHSMPQTTGGVGVAVGSGEARSADDTSRNAFAFADARPCRAATQTTETQPQNQPQPELEPEVPVEEAEVPPVSVASETPTPDIPPAPLPDAEMEEQVKAYFEVPANYLATYLWSFLQHRADVEVIRPWEKFWIADFDKALTDGYSKEDIELAILCSQAGAAKKYYKRGESICNNLDLLIEKGQKLRNKGVLREHECKCHALLAMFEDLQEHQETCETALAIDPEDAAEEEAMYAAEDLIGYGLALDPLPDFAPFSDTREGEDWQ